ncbi:MAG: polysaccharide biosynthesis C-terminal domain-containing protein, partial [Clostridia bacterium]|nr:polysaccharide biosynthesis C-terminal domain-containing protein [Clostridia bacterium]
DLMFAQSVYAMTTIVGYGIYFEKKSVYSFMAVTAGAVLNLGLNFLLIPEYGIRAVALTTLLGYLLNYFVTLYFSKKVYPCNYGEIRVGIVLAVMYFLCMLGEKLAVPYKIGLWVACAAGLIIIFRDIIGHMVSLVRTKFMKGRNA